jgi:DNA invertase Pin-like site-specific DNA recombinase
MTESAAVWKRVSTDMTRQEIRNQDDEINGHLTARGYNVARTFELEASAYHGEHQTALDQVLADVRAGLYTVVVFAMTSRIERRGHQKLLRFIWDLQDAGARVESTDNPNFGQPGFINDMLTMVLGNADHEYSKKISENVSRAFRRMDTGGSFRGSVPTGYAVTGEKRAKQLTPSDGVCRCPNAANAPKYHARCLISAQQVIDAIEACGTGTSTLILGKRLGMTADAVAKMIRNPIYGTGRYEITHRCPNGCPEKDGAHKTALKAGKAPHGVYVYRCQPLVKPEVQKAAIAALEARHTGDNVASRSIAKEDFSGAVWCGLHMQVDGKPGEPMYRYYSGKDGARVRRYRCGACRASVKADEADKAVNALMASDESWWQRARLIEGDDNAAAIARVQDELDNLGTRRLSRAEHRAESDRLYDELERLQALPSTPARTVYERVKDASGRVMSEGEHWLTMSMPERRLWMLGRAAVSHYPIVKAAPGRTGAVIAEIAYVPDVEPQGA